MKQQLTTKCKNLLNRLFDWRFRLSERSFLLILGVLVGLVSGLAAVLLKNLIHYFGMMVINFFTADSWNFLFLLVPVIGVSLSFIYVKYILKDDISHGVSRVLHSISKGKGKLNKSKSYSSIIASTLTIGFGGSVGPEAPVVLTGAAIGSTIGQFFKVDYKTLVLLIACGSTGAVAGIFGAPLAGVVFALEVLMIDLTMASIIPLLISSVTAATLSALLMGREVLFRFDVQTDFVLEHLPFFLILGLATGLVSTYFLFLSEKIETIFSNISRIWLRVIGGGFILSILIFFFPPLYGEGFNFLSDIFQGNSTSLLNNTFLYDYRDNTWILLCFVLALIFLKVIAMAMTNGSGGIGGVFAPSMFVGALLGMFVATFLNLAFGLNLSVPNFTMAGMAGVMAGVMHAPLTAMFLVAEITGGYKFVIPLMLVSAASYLVCLYFRPHSIYTKKLAQKGELFTHNKDAVALSMLDLRDMIETNFSTILYSANLGDLVKTISGSPRNVFPVVDETNKYLGVVFLDDVKPLIFRSELYDKILVKEIMFQPICTADISESTDEIASKFLHISDYNIPILDKGKYIGFVSRANIFSNYRVKLKELSND